MDPTREDVRRPAEVARRQAARRPERVEIGLASVHDCSRCMRRGGFPTSRRATNRATSADSARREQLPAFDVELEPRDVDGRTRAHRARREGERYA